MQSDLHRQQVISDAFSTSYDYDPAGNLQQLTRRGYVPETDSYEAIDRLKYGVSGGRLNTVDELLTTPEAALGFAQSSGYGYDAAGNLTSNSSLRGGGEGTRSEV